jgi:hypothetical protein
MCVRIREHSAEFRELVVAADERPVLLDDHVGPPATAGGAALIVHDHGSHVAGVANNDGRQTFPCGLDQLLATAPSATLCSTTGRCLGTNFNATNATATASVIEAIALRYSNQVAGLGVLMTSRARKPVPN